jgi:hypothetical protein
MGLHETALSHHKHGQHHSQKEMRAEMSLDTCLPTVAYSRWQVVVDRTSGVDCGGRHLAYRFSSLVDTCPIIKRVCALKRLEEKGTSACIETVMGKESIN